MSKFDVKIGEENQKVSPNTYDLNNENLKLHQEIQYLNYLIRESEHKRREQHRTTNKILMWILICIIIYIIPDIIIKIVNFVTLTDILQETNILIR